MTITRAARQAFPRSPGPTVAVEEARYSSGTSIRTAYQTGACCMPVSRRRAARSGCSRNGSVPVDERSEVRRFGDRDRDFIIRSCRPVVLGADDFFEEPIVVGPVVRARRPRHGEGAGIVDRDEHFQALAVGCDAIALDDMNPIGMRRAEAVAVGLIVFAD